SREMTELRFRISREKHQHLMGQEARALVVEKGTVERSMVARTENYLPVVIKDQSVGLGEWIDLRFTRLEDSYLYGKII
ncbi:MAG: TRAM domain-containing protein, partial [Candidatus Thermoplasmatota archaeon]|nr:TRAM domain-containing protein [Candidatus Thermoplasmatota archaeon]